MVSNLVNNTFRPWTKIGLRPVVADTLLRAYPNARRPTNVQKKMLTALNYGYSVAARGLPGTGKSFAIAAWLLGLERAMREVAGENNSKKLVPTTSALVIVPNVDLAIQYHCTIMNMLSASGSDAVRSSPDSFVQVLYRKNNEAELEQLIKLQRFPHPHLIIAPPTIILDILADKDEAVRNLVDIVNLKAIVLEEIDAAITKLQYFSKMKKGKGGYSQSWQNRQVPVQILLDYIIKVRNNEALRAGKQPEQPQLVFPTATLSTTQIKRFLLLWHREWLDSTDRNLDQPRLFTSSQPGEEWKRRVRSNSILAVEEPPLSHDKIVQFVPDNLHHHIVAYNIVTGDLRDAPVPRFNTTHRETLAAEVAALEESHRGSTNDPEIGLDSWHEDAEPNKFLGYPEEVALKILQKLLKQDNYPRNVIAMIGSEANMMSFREKAAAQGITVKPLLARKWNDNQESGTLPLGRSDMLLDKHIRNLDNTSEETGDKSKTTVWLSNFFFCRGLDAPGIRHVYILHRMDRAREYITYAGRVAKWPYATHDEEIRDPESHGKDRRGTGKVVSVILEEPDGRSTFVPKWRQNEDAEFQTIVLKNNGSAMEKRAWAEEAVRLAKIGCRVEPYFSSEESIVERKAEPVESKVKPVEEEVEVEVEERKGEEPVPAFLMEALGILDESASTSGKSGEEGAEELKDGELKADRKNKA